MELPPNKMVDALRKCGGTLVCDGCPYQELGTARCIQTMQKDAAAMIEGMNTIIADQAGRIEACLDRIRKES